MNIKEFTETVAASIDEENISIDLNKSFLENGGYSLAAVKLSDFLYPKTGIVLNFFDIMGEDALESIYIRLTEDNEKVDEVSLDMEEGTI